MGRDSMAVAGASRKKTDLGKIKDSGGGVVVETVDTYRTAQDGARSDSKHTAEGMETLEEALPSQSRSGGNSSTSVSQEGKGGESGSAEQENSAAGGQSPDDESGGVIPEIVLASTTKGRFASLVR